MIVEILEITDLQILRAHLRIASWFIYVKPAVPTEFLANHRFVRQIAPGSYRAGMTVRVPVQASREQRVSSAIGA